MQRLPPSVFPQDRALETSAGARIAGDQAQARLILRLGKQVYQEREIAQHRYKYCSPSGNVKRSPRGLPWSAPTGLLQSQYATTYILRISSRRYHRISSPNSICPPSATSKSGSLSAAVRRTIVADVPTSFAGPENPRRRRHTYTRVLGLRGDRC